MPLRSKHIVLGVTGGIAAYKSCELVRLLVKNESRVYVAMTQAAQKFVTPLTFQTLSKNRVCTDLFDPVREREISHIDLADRAELMIIAPATANFIGKVRAGIADDLLTTTVMATRAPVLIAPAMNVNMWNNPVVQENVKALKELGYRFVGPRSGELACGWEGAGRMSEPEDIVWAAECAMARQDLSGLTVLITAGPTREPFDPVRFITNRSSGKMGYAIARTARLRGARTILVSGPVNLDPAEGIECIRVNTAQEMFEKVMGHISQVDVIVKAAAVGDYRPRQVSEQKIKKAGAMTVDLDRNPDIAQEIGKAKTDQVVVGFAAETEALVENAVKKLEKKNMDFIVANDVTRRGAGFEVDTNIVRIINRKGRVRRAPRMSKEELSMVLLDEVVLYIQDRKAGRSPTA